MNLVLVLLVALAGWFLGDLFLANYSMPWHARAATSVAAATLGRFIVTRASFAIEAALGEKWHVAFGGGSREALAIGLRSEGGKDLRHLAQGEGGVAATLHGWWLAVVTAVLLRFLGVPVTLRVAPYLLLWPLFGYPIGHILGRVVALNYLSVAGLWRTTLRGGLTRLALGSLLAAEVYRVARHFLSLPH